MKSHRRPTMVRALWLGSVLSTTLACSHTQSATFDTPRNAMLSFAEVVGTDAPSIDRCLGEGGHELLDSGDAAADLEDAQWIKKCVPDGLAFDDLSAERKVALLGDEHWAFPIPLVSGEGGWRFDLASAREELLARHIGANELLTIATLREYGDAQREYVVEGRDGNAHAFARRLISCEGKHDGLYWPSAEGEPESPFGPMVAGAACEEEKSGDHESVPFHGYYFRTLCAQGKSAPEGEKNYVEDKGLMTGGYALLAWPATYGVTGVMTFQVNHGGLVFQADLGPDTEKSAAKIQAYDPGESWSPTTD